jgi:hypothetical protein
VPTCRGRRPRWDGTRLTCTILSSHVPLERLWKDGFPSLFPMENFGRFWCHFSSTLTAYQSMESRSWENDITLCTCWNHLASQCCCHLNTMVYAEKNHHPPEIWYLRPNQDPELALHSSRFSVCQPGCLGISPAICKAEQFALGPSF